MQTLGPWKRAVTYLSKKLDPMTMAWPPFPRIIVVAATMVKDADKLALEQNLTIELEGVLKQLPNPMVE